MLREQIAASLEVAFSQQGFAEPSVAQLKTACNVSLRTLYKHFPSKEAMIVGALEHRHQRYLSLLLEDSPRSGYQAITHIFNKLQQWMEEYAPHGCLSMNALAAFPDNELINQAVIEHKKEVQALMAKQSQREDLASELFLLHEGVSSAWPVLGEEAVASAQNMVTKLLKETV
ncbi:MULTISPECIES: TetR/AcrR family transcriptional regulator [Vibrio]|jgi:AcrR family transcriptional regulator|uniref:TetR/AcrR family transcriptional regulator n=1 Tax=Vibrio TaxID=662 RepID=UPI000769B5C0|nr:TetR/AcrR family transcriptional regulator [Vibrio splendidus]MBU2908176.1 TetR/AcrR family transcriptional regulator [Vibrio splendidus]MCC4883184.1 TetR/AcrR family transcriptional regulator [Vibrio splendidus]MDO6529317.1 TetR/AcrR family transcriptional regulator [Vibrio splendidus]MDO6550062.1 TetR/AcrR family transcriptional regulator [Vibrio splendidus]PHX08020.1 putative transcriptional regulator [Vibrio splendidus]